MQKVIITTALGLAVLLCSPAALAKKNKNCPEPGAEATFAQVMNDAFADDYVGCDIKTTACSKAA